jgi:hypothetical protein
LFVCAKDLFVEANGGPLKQGRIRQPLLAPPSLLMDEQKKHFGSYQQGNERNNPMPTGLDLFRPSAFLRRSDTQSEEKIAHRPIPSLFLI